MKEPVERSGPTDEVGDEGGTPGDVEIDSGSLSTGTESTSTVAAKQTRIVERDRDESGEGRRSP